MKLLVIGVGDCGCRIAGSFTELNKRARADKKVQVVNGAYAINNDREWLVSLTKNEFRDLLPVLINHEFENANKSALAGAEMMKIEGGRVLTGIKSNDFYDTDAILFIIGTAGRLGSGGVPVLMQLLKDRHIGKPLYALAVLPFESESEDQDSIYNTALCLKSLQKVADAIFLADNEKFKLYGNSTSQDDKKSLENINMEIAEPYYDLLCATETLDPKFAGARHIGIGDMLQTLSGYTAIGTGKTPFSINRSLFKSMANFQEKGSETQKTMEAMNLALGKLSIDLKLEDSRKALYLLSIPAQGANLDMVKVMGNRLREMTNNALIRGGDFYGARDHAQVTLLFSDLAYVECVKKYFDKAVGNVKPAKPAAAPARGKKRK
jgi:cell division GTPase FtsZ